MILGVEEGRGHDWAGALFASIVVGRNGSSEKPRANPIPRWRTLASSGAADVAARTAPLAIPGHGESLANCLEGVELAWRRQAQLVADLFAVAGRRSILSEQIIAFCLANHAAPALVRDVVHRKDDRSLIRRVPEQIWTHRKERIGHRLARHLCGKTQARVHPILTYTGLPALLYLETCSVGATTMELLLDRLDVEAPRPSRSQPPAR